MKTIDIIIVNWNSKDQLRSCLRSIAEVDQEGYQINRVVVVDNSSQDDSIQNLEEIPVPLVLIRNSKNHGFGSACNQGAHGSEANYLLFLNPDTVLFQQSLRSPMEFMERPENSQVGICGIQLVDQHKNISRSCAHFPSLKIFLSKILGVGHLWPHRMPTHALEAWDHAESRPVDQVIGAFFLIRRSLFESLHGFDERFFVYFEEVDLSLRAYHAGWSSFYLAEAQAFHQGGGTSSAIKAQRLFYSLRSRILYGHKHFDRSEAILLTTFTLAVEPFTRLVFSLMKKQVSEARETIVAYYLLLQYLMAQGMIAQKNRFRF